MKRSSGQGLERYAWLAIAASIVTISLKAGAAWFTGSVGLLSDAAESVVNLVAAVAVLFALKTAAKAPDDDFGHGREKVEYLSAGVEGTMIVVAAALIAYSAIERLINPVEVERLGLGVAISTVAGIVNLVVGMLLLRVGIRERSITLEADGRHLLTDVWTSAGVVLGVGLVALTGWAPLDAIVAMAVAANIVLSGFGLIRRSVRGLLDASLPPDQVEQINAVLRTYSGPLVQFHALRTRQAGRRSFVSFHMLVPGDQSVLEAHDIVERVEAELAALIDGLSVISHIEPLEDPRSYADEGLERPTFLTSMPSLGVRPVDPAG